MPASFHPFGDDISIFNRYAKGSFLHPNGFSSRTRIHCEQIIQHKVIPQRGTISASNQNLYGLTKVSSESIFGKWLAFRKKTMPNFILKYLSWSLSQVLYIERIASYTRNYLFTCEIATDPSAFGIDNSPSVQQSGIGAGLGGGSTSSRNTYGVLQLTSLSFNGSQSAKRVHGTDAPNNGESQSAEGYKSIRDSGPPIGFGASALIAATGFFGGWGLEWYSLFCVKSRIWKAVLFVSGVCIMACGLGWLILYGWLCDRCNGQSPKCASQRYDDGGSHMNTVTQKLLTMPYYCNTLIYIGRLDMANVLSIDKQVAIISALAEGSGIRQIERITGVHRDTIMRLGVRVGKGCASLLDSKMRDLTCENLQFDELWGFIGKKQKHVQPEESRELGDVWTFCAIDSDTKLVPSFKVGKRDMATANAFVGDVASRMTNRVQISTDGLPGYVEAVERAFGMNVDYAQIVKVYESEAADAEVIRVDKRTFAGRPDLSAATTSHVERLNGTTRLHMRRLTRLTYAFSKKLENFEVAVALHFAYYNLVKRHNALRATPAMAAGIEKDFWTVGNLIEAAV